MIETFVWKPRSFFSPLWKSVSDPGTPNLVIQITAKMMLLECFDLFWNSAIPVLDGILTHSFKIKEKWCMKLVRLVLTVNIFLSRTCWVWQKSVEFHCLSWECVVGCELVRCVCVCLALTDSGLMGWLGRNLACVALALTSHFKRAVIHLHLEIH